MKTIVKTISAAVLCATSVAFAGDLLVNGAGATFPYPLYSKWFSEYNKLNPTLKFNYQSIGSGGGIKQISERTVDFGATDSPMTDAELQKAPGVIHVPMILGAVAVVQNGAPASVKLTASTLANIFLGKIAKWNDAKIAAANPGVTLPDVAITVVHRSDGSGTTGVFTDYLAKVSADWKTQVGAGKAVKWPVGLGGKGNEGVTGSVKSTPGAIGYVELAYAKQNKLQMVALQNADGNFVVPAVESTSAAAASVTLPDDFRVSITNAKGKEAYPISAFTYLLVYQDQADAEKGRALGKFLWWSIHDGQKLAPALDYAPLPAAVVTRVENQLKTIRTQGKSVIASN